MEAGRCRNLENLFNWSARVTRCRHQRYRVPVPFMSFNDIAKNELWKEYCKQSLVHDYIRRSYGTTNSTKYATH